MIIDIFLNDRFYGALRLDNKRGGVYEQDEVTATIERRLPLLKGKNYKIKF